MRSVPQLETVITLSIHTVIATVIMFLLYALMRWILVEYEVIGEE